jgi:hypothetical protein
LVTIVNVTRCRGCGALPKRPARPAAAARYPLTEGSLTVTFTGRGHTMIFRPNGTDIIEYGPEASLRAHIASATERYQCSASTLRLSVPRGEWQELTRTSTSAGPSGS